MPLNLVKPNEPGSNAIRKLMENDDTCYGRADRGIYNKYELDHLYDVLGRTRRYTRELALGHTLSSYTNWTHIQTQDGMSIWRYPLTNYVHDDNNELYNDDVKLVYLASATSVATPKSFDRVFMSNSARTAPVFIDNTTEAGTASGTPFNLLSGLVTQEVVSAVTYIGASNLAYTNILDGTLTVYSSGYSTTYTEDTDYTMDYTVGTITVLSTGNIASGTNITVNYTVGNTVYLGVSAAKFGSINIDLATTGVGNRLQFAYSSGANWQTFVPTDNTNNLATDGNINWDADSLVGWTKSTVNAVSGIYWIRIKPINTGIVTPTAKRLIVGDAAITTLLAMSQSDFDANQYTWGHYAGNLYVAIPNAGDPQNEGVTYITNGSSTDAKKNYFVYNNTYLINYVNNDAEAKAVTMVTDVTLSGGTYKQVVNDLVYYAMPSSGCQLKFQIVTTNNLSSVQLYANVATGVAASGMVCRFVMDYTTLVDGSTNIPITASVSGTYTVPTAGQNAFITLSGINISNANLNSGITTVCCNLHRETCTNNLSGILYLRNLLYDTLAIAGNGGSAGGTGGGGEANTASNVGGGAGELFKQKTGVDLEFKTLTSGTGITITNNASTVSISTTAEANTVKNSGTGAGKVYKSKSGSVLNFKSIASGNGITLVNGSSTITINRTNELVSGISSIYISGIPTFNLESVSGKGVYFQVTRTDIADTHILQLDYNGLSSDHQLKLTGTSGTLVETTTFNASGLNTKQLKISNTSGAFVAIKTQASTASYTLNMPKTAGSSGTTLINNGAGTFTWGTGGEIATANNVGSGTGTVFKTKSGTIFTFKRIASGTGITLVNGTNDIIINATAPTSGYAMLAVANTFIASQKAPVFNATTTLKLSGTSINTAGKLSNVVYKNQNNTITGSQTLNTITVNSTIIANKKIRFATNPTTGTLLEGDVFWDYNNNCLAYQTQFASSVNQIGQEVVVSVCNITGVTLNNGTVVYISGASTVHGHPTVSPARADAYDKSRVIGVLTTTIPNNSCGLATFFGNVNNLNTTAFTEGATLYLSPTVSGTYTASAPTGGNFIVIVGTVTIKSAAQGRILVAPKANDFTTESLQMVGWSTNALATLTWTDTSPDRTLTLAPAAGLSSFHFYQNGVKYTKTTDSKQLPNEEGLFFVYYNLGTLTYTKNPSLAQQLSIIKNNPLVGYVYWNATAGAEEYIGYELHDMQFNSTIHVYNHFAYGARYITGLALASMVVDGNGSLNSHARFGVGAGAIVDEDLYFPTDTITSISGLRIHYLSGTSTTPTLRVATKSSFSILTNASGIPYYNKLSGTTWRLSAVTNNTFMLYHVFADNHNTKSKRVLTFMGQAQYATKALAEAAAKTEINAIQIAGIVPQEMKSLATIILEVKTAYTNAVNARIVSTDTGANYVDWRAVNTTGGGGGSTSNITSFSDDQFQVFDGSDATKVVKLQVSTVSAGVTRVLSVPTSDGTIALTSNLTQFITSGKSAGTGVGVFYKKSGTELQFKTLKSGTNVTFTQASNMITINATGGGGASGAALLAAANNFTLSQTAPTWNATSLIKLSGTSINTAGKLSNVVYKNQNNTFTGASQTAVTLNATTALKQSGNAVVITATNSGVGAGKIYKGKVGNNLAFKSILSGTNITIVNGASAITINATGGGGASGAALLTAANNFTASQTATVFNAKTTLKLSGTSINTAGKLSNVVYKNQNNVFTGSQTLVNMNATTAIKLSGVSLVSKFMLTNFVWSSQTANYTLVAGNAGNGVKMTNASARTITIPASATVGFAIGTQIMLLQYGAGQLSVSGLAGVTLRSISSRTKLNGQYTMASLCKIASNEWILAGDII